MAGADDPLVIQQRLYEYEAEFEAQSAALQEAYAEISRSRDRYRVLFEEAPVALVVVDKDTRVLQVNARAEALLERERSLIVDTPLMNRVAAMHHLSLRSNLDIAYSRGRGTTTVARLAGDGLETWVRVDTGRLDLGGQRRLLVVLHDITRQYLAEEGLRKSEARFRSLFEASADAVALLDGASLTLQEINPAFVRLTGIHPEELLGSRVRGFFPEEQRWAVSATLRQALHQGEAGPLAVSLEPEGKPRRRVALSARSVRVGGGLFAMVTLRDMTEQWNAVQRRRAVERQLWQVNRVEMLGAMAGGVAGGISEALGTVRGRLASALASTESPTLTAELQAALDAVDTGEELAQRLIGLASRAGEDRRVVAVDELVAQAVHRVSRQPQVGQRVQALVEERDLHVRGDTARLVQALDHLLMVGVHACPDGQPLQVRVRSMQVDAEIEQGGLLSAGQYVAVEVCREDGEALDGERLASAAQAPEEGARASGQGPALGLAVARVSFGEHGGNLRVDAEQGRLEAWLPRHQAGADKPDGPVQSVLVWDEEPMVRRAAARMLTGDGYRVSLATTVEEALERATNEAFDAVLVDLAVENEDVLSQLHELDREPLIIAMSSSEERINREQAAGRAQAVLRKPFGTEALRQALATLDRPEVEAKPVPGDEPAGPVPGDAD